MHVAPTESGTSILVANHTNWWDGFLAWLVSRELGLDFHVLMEAANLDRYWMFKWIGALPMRRERAHAAYADLMSAAQYLEDDATSLWVFPQGSRRPPAEPIAGTEHGAAWIARFRPCVPVIPVAFRYVHLGEQLPEAFIQLGAPVKPPELSTTPRAERKALALEIERTMQRTVAELDQRLATEDLSGFETLLAGRLSINKGLDRVRHAAGTIDGPFERRNG